MPSPTSPTLPAANASPVAPAARAAMDFIRRQPQWIVLGALYLLAWYTPFAGGGYAGDGPAAWCWSSWKSGAFPLGFQPFIPLAAAALIWSDRAALSAKWRHITGRFAPGNPRREGNLIPLALSALLLFAAHFVEVKGIGVIAMIGIAVGIVYRLYGPLMLKSLRVPLALLCLMIPPPDSFVEHILVHNSLQAVLKTVILILSLGHIDASISIIGLIVSGYEIDTPGDYSSGFGILTFVSLLLLTYHLYQRTFATEGPLALFTGAVCALTAQVVRMLLVVVTMGANPTLALFIQYSVFVTYFQIFGVFFLTENLIGLRLKNSKKNSAARSAARHASQVSRTGTKVVETSIDRILGFLGAWWGRSERGIERGFKALTPKSKRKRRPW